MTKMKNTTVQRHLQDMDPSYSTTTWATYWNGSTGTTLEVSLSLFRIAKRSIPDYLLTQLICYSKLNPTTHCACTDFLSSWLDRLPFVLLFGIATSADSFEDRLSGNCLRQIQGDRFDVTQSDEIIEKVFDATIGKPDVRLHIGPNLCRRMLDRQKDHVQNVQDFCDGLKYAYMSHFYASCPSVFLKEDVAFEDLTPDAFKAVRNLPSFRQRVEQMLDDGQARDVRELIDSDEALFNQITEHIRVGQLALTTLSHAARVLSGIRKCLQMSPDIRPSSMWVRAASADLLGSPILRETMLSIKKAPSDKLAHLLEAMQSYEGDYLSIKLSVFQQELGSLLEENDSSTPLRTQYDVRIDSLRTTVVAQKVLLSKHKAALSKQDKAYSDLVARLHDQLDAYFVSAFIDPRSLFLSEVFMYDLKSPHLEVFQPKPRFAVERALTSPHDYLGCDCCGGSSEKESALSSTQPATAIVYQLYLESGALMNVSDLWSAFNAIAGNNDEEDQTQTM
jgi:origin recognition complex subunit 3